MNTKRIAGAVVGVAAVAGGIAGIEGRGIE